MRRLAALAAFIALGLALSAGGFPQTVALPVTTIVSQIHNAPGWLPSTSYSYTATRPFVRVNAGAGWTASSKTWNPGQPLAAYQLDSASPVPCTSAASGSGPSGTGQLIADGTCKWDYLSNTDYITLTGWAFDNQKWVSGTHYGNGAIVTAGSPLWAYGQVNSAGCTSTVQPTGTTASTAVPNVLGADWLAFDYNAYSDSCWWAPMAAIGYSSQASYIPTQTYTGSQTFTVNMAVGYEAELWDDAEYEAGVNGENAPIETMYHQGYGSEGGTLNGCEGDSGTGTLACPHIIITTAPGESFEDILTPSDALTFPSPANGVMVYTNSTTSYPTAPDGIAEYDNFTDVIGLQVQSVNGAAIGDIFTFNNGSLIAECICEGGGAAYSVVGTDTSNAIVNSLLIANGALVGVVQKYPGFLLHDTIVAPGKNADVCMEMDNQWVFNPTLVVDVACFGFAHMGAYDTSTMTGTPWASTSSHNVTDAPAGDSGTTTWYLQGAGGTGATVDTVPGTTYGESDTGVFQNFASDWRNPGSGILYGAGAAAGQFPLYCATSGEGLSCAQRTIYNFDTPDVIGTTRPQAHGTDIGAWQHP